MGLTLKDMTKIVETVYDLLIGKTFNEENLGNRNKCYAMWTGIGLN